MAQKGAAPLTTTPAQGAPVAQGGDWSNSFWDCFNPVETCMDDRPRLLETCADATFVRLVRLLPSMFSLWQDHGSHEGSIPYELQLPQWHGMLRIAV
jgi:hypothetical protein